MFTILTVSRTGETLGAKPEEFDFENKVWTVPAERMKAGREHRVPLTDEAIAIVKSLIEPEQKYVFHNEYGRQLSNMTMLKALRAVRDDGPTVHGFRSSFRDWAAEQTDAPREVVEACLAHAVGDAAELAYKRSDFLEKRRTVLQRWTTLCANRN
jgi:integrase